jgi:dGTPase
MTWPHATSEAPPWNVRRHEHRQSAGGRSDYEVDKDRIIHCETFRALQYKTQVQPVAYQSQERFRTRLNHVIEVAQIARSLAGAIGADEFLAEAIALGHDLGHPPFGHAGERALRKLLRAAGHPEWNANVHSLAVVDFIERSHMRHRGLNLTWATREGIARHATPFDEPVSFGEFADTPNGGVECQIVDAADVIAYLSHDLDDALSGDFVTIEAIATLDDRLESLLEATLRAWEEVGNELWPRGERDALVRKALVSRLIGAVVSETAEESVRRVGAFGIESPTDVRSCQQRVVMAPEPVDRLIRSLLEFLTANYYRSDSVTRADRWGEETIYRLFNFLLEHPDYVPERFTSEDRALSVAHYLISLDDQSAGRLAEDAERVLG